MGKRNLRRAQSAANAVDWVVVGKKFI